VIGNREQIWPDGIRGVQKFKRWETPDLVKNQKARKKEKYKFFPTLPFGGNRDSELGLDSSGRFRTRTKFF
jgi:hypothetical protein